MDWLACLICALNGCQFQPCWDCPLLSSVLKQTGILKGNNVDSIMSHSFVLEPFRSQDWLQMGYLSQVSWKGRNHLNDSCIHVPCVTRKITSTLSIKKWSGVMQTFLFALRDIHQLQQLQRAKQGSQLMYSLKEEAKYWLQFHLLF